MDKAITQLGLPESSNLDQVRKGVQHETYSLHQMVLLSLVLWKVKKSNDLHTLKPLLKQMMPHYREYLENIVADAGYESAENYSYLKINHLNAYIKPANYGVKKSKKYRNDIGKKENMTYLENEDFYLCQNNKKLVRGKDSVKKYESGFKDTVHAYTCYECISCPFNSDCIKSRKDGNRPRKTIKFSPHFELCRQESEENLKTNEGINHRINRSIQAEGVFSKLKDGLGYKRFLHRSLSTPKILESLTFIVP